VSAADAWLLAGALALTLAAALFAAAQTALSKMSRARALKLAEEGRRGAQRVLALLEQPARTLNILALLALVVQVATAALLTVVAVRYLVDGAAVAVAVAVGSAALFVGAEVAPKTLALQQPERVACATALWVSVLARPLAPIARLLIGAGNVIAPGRGLAQGPFVTEDELREMIDVAESDEVIEESERAMIHSIFELGDTIVREIMVPRPDMVMVSADDSLRSVLDVILRAGHSRIPVYRDDRDKIVGLIYAKDVLRRLHVTGDEEGPWEDLLRAAFFVPEFKQVDDLLRELQTQKVHLAIVVDEYGATAGLVTIEDILEEIVGEIVDEYDTEEDLVEQLSEHVWRVDARLPVADLNVLIDRPLPSQEWDTVGGLLFGLLGHVPAPGEHVEAEQVRLVAERVKGRRIAKVIVKRLPRPA
jgi:CBS domain containing-hemolysin-like protein